MTRFPDIKIIVFDLDDTLYPETQFVRSGFQTVAAYLKNSGISSKNLFPEMWKKFCDGERRTIFNNVLSNSGINPEEILVNKIVDVYRNHEPSISLYPDARPILEHFINRKKIGLLTDGYLQMQKNKVKALEIDIFFDIIVFTDEIGGIEFWKPNPAGYKKIMDHFGFSGKNCLYVGDNPSKDFYGARILGWKTVQIKRPDGIYKDKKDVLPDYQADISIKDLNQLTSIIKLP